MNTPTVPDSDLVSLSSDKLLWIKVSAKRPERKCKRRRWHCFRRTSFRGALCETQTPALSSVPSLSGFTILCRRAEQFRSDSNSFEPQTILHRACCDEVLRWCSRPSGPSISRTVTSWARVQYRQEVWQRWNHISILTVRSENTQWSHLCSTHKKKHFIRH